MRPAVPYDRNHPGFSCLTPSEQKKLASLTLKEKAKEPLNGDETRSLKHI